MWLMCTNNQIKDDVRPGDDEICFCWQWPFVPSRLFPLMMRILAKTGSLEFSIMADDVRCLACLLSKSRWVGRLTNKLMDKADNSWPILSLLMYWGHWLPRISMNTFWMILCILFVRKLYLFFDHLICALHVHTTLMRPWGYCHNSVMCSRPWPAPLYLIVCYVRANELNTVSRLMRRRGGHHALVTGHHWLACHSGLQTRGQWPHTCYQPPSQHWHWPTEYSHHSHCTHSAKYTW